MPYHDSVCVGALKVAANLGAVELDSVSSYFHRSDVRLRRLCSLFLARTRAVIVVDPQLMPELDHTPRPERSLLPRTSVRSVSDL